MFRRLTVGFRTGIFQVFPMLAFAAQSQRTENGLECVTSLIGFFRQQGRQKDDIMEHTVSLGVESPTIGAVQILCVSVILEDAVLSSQAICAHLRAMVSGDVTLVLLPSARKINAMIHDVGRCALPRGSVRQP